MPSQPQLQRVRGLSVLYQQATRQPVKQAAYEASHTMPMQQAQAKRDAFKQLMTLLGLGAAAGGGARMLMGGHNLFRDTQAPVRRISPVPPTITIPGKAEEDDMEKLGVAKPPWWDWIAQKLPKITTTKPLGDVWGPTAGIGAAGGGIYGGWKLTDWLLNKERQQQNTRDLTEAEDEYKKALADQYRAAMLAKQGADTLGIDDLYEQYAARVTVHGRDKAAFSWDTPWSAVFGKDNVQGVKGALLAAMALTAGGSGVATYNWTKGRSKHNLLERAMRQRARMRAARAPSPIYTQVAPQPSVIDEEEEIDQLNAA